MGKSTCVRLSTESHHLRGRSCSKPMVEGFFSRDCGDRHQLGFILLQICLVEHKVWATKVSKLTYAPLEISILNDLLCLFHLH